MLVAQSEIGLTREQVVDVVVQASQEINLDGEKQANLVLAVVNPDVKWIARGSPRVKTITGRVCRCPAVLAGYWEEESDKAPRDVAEFAVHFDRLTHHNHFPEAPFMSKHAWMSPDVIRVID